MECDDQEGKSRLACRRTTILPAMTLPEALDTTRLPRVAGRTADCTACVTTRPFRAPHHTISDVGLIGGGQVPTPGDFSLVHHGVRCLGERPECRRRLALLWTGCRRDGLPRRRTANGDDHPDGGGLKL